MSAVNPAAAGDGCGAPGKGDLGGAPWCVPHVSEGLKGWGGRRGVRGATRPALQFAEISLASCGEQSMGRERGQRQAAGCSEFGLCTIPDPPTSAGVTGPMISMPKPLRNP